MKRWMGFGLVLAGFLRVAPGQTNGIFADFATSKGAFTVWLDHERAPRAVASFVGLATGEGGWMDPEGNVWQGRKFYDGSIFHRVLNTVSTNPPGQTNGIAIQGGGFLWRSVDTNGVATTNFANAGYYMPEAVTNGLLHSNGVISMANSGPNTDGSQFFVTATSVPGWDGGYTVFGHVTTGMNVVTSIATVAVQGSGSRPVQDVVLSNVVVRRVGAAAEAFNVASQGVPVVESGALRAYTAGSNLILEIESVEQSEMTLRESTNLLSAWDGEDWGFYTNASMVFTGAVPRAELGDTYFFHSSRIRYPTPITAPATQRSSPLRYFTFWWNTANTTKYEVIFAASPANQGAYQVTQGTNAPVVGSVFAGDTWTRNPYSARLYFFDDSGKEQTYLLGFNPGQATNRFTGTVVDWFAGSTYSISGTFTIQ